MSQGNPEKNKQHERSLFISPKGYQHEGSQDTVEFISPSRHGFIGTSRRSISITSSNRSLLRRVNELPSKRSKSSSRVRTQEESRNIQQRNLRSLPQRRIFPQRRLRTPTEEELKRLRHRWARTSETRKVDNTPKKSLRTVKRRVRETPSISTVYSPSQSVYDLSTREMESASGVDYYFIPEFDPLSGEYTIDAWLKRLEQSAVVYDWTEQEIIKQMLSKLSGLARTWCTDLDSIQHSWAEWKRKLRHSFPASENYGQILTEMLNTRARAGDELQSYYVDKMRKMKRCNIYGKEAADCLIYGIDDKNIRGMARVAKFDDPEDVIKFFRDLSRGKRVSVEVNED